MDCRQTVVASHKHPVIGHWTQHWVLRVGLPPGAIAIAIRTGLHGSMHRGWVIFLFSSAHPMSCNIIYTIQVWYSDIPHLSFPHLPSPYSFSLNCSSVYPSKVLNWNQTNGLVQLGMVPVWFMVQTSSHLNHDIPSGHAMAEGFWTHHSASHIILLSLEVDLQVLEGMLPVF